MGNWLVQALITRDWMVIQNLVLICAVIFVAFRHVGNGLALESNISADARKGLEARGHRLVDRSGAWGGFQGIIIDPKTGVLHAGSDPRKDGLAIGW